MDGSFNPFRWFSSGKPEQKPPEPAQEHVGSKEDPSVKVFVRPEDVGKYEQGQIIGMPVYNHVPSRRSVVELEIKYEVVRLAEVPIGAVIKVKTDNSEYWFEKVSEKQYLISAFPERDSILNGETRVEIGGGLVGGSMIKTGVLAIGLGIEYYVEGSAGSGTTSAVRFLSIRKKE